MFVWVVITVASGVAYAAGQAKLTAFEVRPRDDTADHLNAAKESHHRAFVALKRLGELMPAVLDAYRKGNLDDPAVDAAWRARRDAEVAARKAVKLAPSVALHHFTLACILRFRSGARDEMVSEMGIARRLKPNLDIPDDPDLTKILEPDRATMPPTSDDLKNERLNAAIKAFLDAAEKRNLQQPQ